MTDNSSCQLLQQAAILQIIVIIESQRQVIDVCVHNTSYTKFIFCVRQEDCKSFRRGDACCEFICLDDTLSSISNDKPDGAGTNIIDGNANYDLGLRSVASFVTAILSMSLLFFLIHRLRQRKIQGKRRLEYLLKIPRKL